MNSRRITVSMALIALICFFMPWVQISCGESKDRLSGVDLARDGHDALWLIPLLLIAVVFFNTARGWKEKRELTGLITLIAGLVSAYLMNRERVRADDASGLIAVGVTGWFWLGFGSALGLVAAAVLRILKRARTG